MRAKEFLGAYLNFQIAVRNLNIYQVGLTLAGIVSVSAPLIFTEPVVRTKFSPRIALELRRLDAEKSVPYFLVGSGFFAVAVLLGDSDSRIQRSVKNLEEIAKQQSENLFFADLDPERVLSEPFIEVVEEPKFTQAQVVAEVINPASNKLKDFKYNLPKELNQLQKPHYAIIAGTGCGKSTFLQECISWDRNDNHTVYVFDGKNDGTFKDFCFQRSIRYFGVIDPNFDELIVTLENLVQEMNLRYQKVKPKNPKICIYIDEHNQTVAALRNYDGLYRTNYANEYLYRFTKLILQGRDANMSLRFSAHSPNVQSWGTTTEVKDSVGIIALARNNNWDSVKKLMAIVEPFDKQQVLEDFETVKTLDITGTVAFTDALGAYRFLELPKASGRGSNSVAQAASQGAIAVVKLPESYPEATQTNETGYPLIPGLTADQTALFCESIRPEYLALILDCLKDELSADATVKRLKVNPKHQSGFKLLLRELFFTWNSEIQ